MSTAPTNVRNYFKLELVIAHSNVILRQLFKNRYSLFNSGRIWDDSPSCGRYYSSNVITKNKQFNFTTVQKISISNGDSKEWDLTTLTTLLLYSDRPKKLNKMQIQQLDNEDKLLKQLRDIRNKLAHHASKSVDDTEFNQLWNELAAILVAFGDSDSELDKLKDDSVFESSTQSINEENAKEAKQFNSLGTQAHRDQKLAEAITLFTKATVLCGVSDHDRAIFYSNMSSSRLALYNQQSSSSRTFELRDSTDQRYRALKDAKQARILWPTWWKGHLRVGKAYVSLNEHEKAINSFERALALDPTNNEIQNALTESRHIHGRQSRQEHLDPRLQPRTMFELLNELKEKMGLDPEQVRMSHSFIGELDPAADDVVKGHKYEHGDIDVKQDYEQAAKYFAKAAKQGNAEGIYNLARLTGDGLGVKKDHTLALKLYEQAAAQPPQHPMCNSLPNIGVYESEHALGLIYADGIGVHKEPAHAAYWYERAVNHGSANSANNLALMYQNGTGVNRDLEKAEQLFHVAARGCDPNAMLSLAGLLLKKNDLQMAKIWYDRACESGNILAQTERVTFEKALQQQQQLIDNCPADFIQQHNAIRKTLDSLKIRQTVYEHGNRHIYDYNILNEHADRGSITARKMCNALEHFGKALCIWMQSDILTEKQEDLFVHELSECYRIEHIVAQIPGIDMRRRIGELIDRILHRCSDIEKNTTFSRLDEDARVCYAVLHMDSHELIFQFLIQCKQQYPKAVFFYELSAAVNGWLKQYQASLYDANTGMQVDPNYEELLYFKAVALRLLGEDMEAAIEAYEAFLVVAPKDHRKVPESYYAMAGCYSILHKGHGVADVVKKVYEQGEEAEKIQLPCFLPYKSTSKTLLKAMFDITDRSNRSVAAPLLDRKPRLTDLHRIEIIKHHREWESRAIRESNDQKHKRVFQTQKPRVKQQTAKSLIGLKPISLKEIDPTKDHVYHGHVLSAIILEKAYSWTPSIHLVVVDEHLDCERMFIYGFPEAQGEYLITETFTIGSKMHIINPYLRLGAHDMKPLIRIDDFSSVIMQSSSERVLNMCRCCGEPNALHVCGKCEQARYCSKECQTIDWQLYKHKLICQKQ